MNDKKIAAFFDIDGTLYRDSLMTEHFKKLKILILTGISALKTTTTICLTCQKRM